MRVTISERLVRELRDWAVDERDYWPQDTAYQKDLKDLLDQLDSKLPTAEDVRGIMSE